MAQVPKTAAPASPQPTASTTRVGPGHRVASYGGTIEEMNAANGVALDAATHDHGRGGDTGLDARTRRDGGDGGRGDTFAYGRLFRADSSVFAAIFEGIDRAPTTSAEPGGRASAPVAKAITIYETNAKVITGTNTLPGMSLSMRL